MADHHSYARVVKSMTTRIEKLTSELLACGPDRHDVLRGQIMALGWAKAELIDEAKKNFEEID